jgi:hypothetical protein
VLAFGAGALISAISFDLAEEGSRLGGGELGCERSGSFHRVPAGIDGADARWRSSAAG